MFQGGIIVNQRACLQPAVERIAFRQQLQIRFSKGERRPSLATRSLYRGNKPMTAKAASLVS